MDATYARTAVRVMSAAVMNRHPCRLAARIGHVSRAARASVLVVIAALLGGCGWFGPTRTALRDVTVVAQSAANSGSATALDLVFVYDAPTAATLPRTGPEWFAQKARLLVALGPRIDVASVQLPAGQSVSRVPLPERHKKALVVYCYVNFVAPAGQGVADLTTYKRVTITLTPDAVSYAVN
ncbi:hypothetical protein WKR88_15355 [Trinickia caryophylli]|nr:hypothetical protein [Trinickia caryophylli]WQE14985.1 hypothetical protein U0034_20750 [Trinickia caryophylli]GLU31286.1 hypothetical protein Busp01_11280 [Trinickia caryophylli]